MEEKDEDQGGTWTGTLTVSIMIYLFEKDVSKKMDDRKLRFISLGVGILVLIMLLAGLSQWLSSKEFACNSGDAGRHGFDPWVRKIP